MSQKAFVDMMSRRAALQQMGLMIGGALSAPLVAGVMAGCQAESSVTNFLPQTLDKNQFELVSTLAEIIIPTTDTPGARDAGVPAFIDKMLTSWYLEDDRKAILTGLNRLEEQAKALFGRGFSLAEENEQTALLEAMAAQGETSSDEVEANNNLADARSSPLPQELPDLFRRIKELTVVGYYTSEIGATQELRVTPMGAYLGDIPYEEAGRAWS